MKAASLAVLFGFAWSAAALAQDRPPVPHIVGDRISESMRIDGQTRMVIDTATLTFQAAAGGQVYTIDFVTGRRGHEGTKTRSRQRKNGPHAVVSGFSRTGAVCLGAGATKTRKHELPEEERMAGGSVRL